MDCLSIKAEWYCKISFWSVCLADCYYRNSMAVLARHNTVHQKLFKHIDCLVKLNLEVIVMSIKNLDQRFGASAAKMGFITSEQLIEALAVQVKENVNNGSHRLVGSILLEKGYMNLEQIDQVLKDML